MHNSNIEQATEEGHGRITPAGVVLGTIEVSGTMVVLAMVLVGGGVLGVPGVVDSAVLEVGVGVVGGATGDVLASIGVEVLCGDESGMAVVWGGSEGVDSRMLVVSVGEGVVLWSGRLVSGVTCLPFAFCTVLTTFSAAPTTGASNCSVKLAALSARPCMGRKGHKSIR